MKPACSVLLLMLAGPAQAGPRVTAFECQIGSGRGIHPDRDEELESDDELACHATISDLGGRGAADLVAELRAVPRRGSFRAVASAALEPAGLRARTPELYVNHSTWSSAIDWRGPTLKLVLCILDRPAAGAKAWRIVATTRLVLTKRTGR